MKKSYLHALGAFGYIALLVTFMNLKGLENTNEMIAGITMLSLFVFSAALMGYLFLSEPIMLYMDGKKGEAVKFFIETLLTFGALLLVVLITSFAL